MIVGVTIFLRQGRHSIWSSGADQACVFLAQQLQLCPSVEKVYLINGGEADLPHPALLLDGAGLDVVRVSEVVDQLDVYIEAGAQVERAAAERVRARGGHVVGYRFGNSYVIDAERAIHNTRAGSIMDGVRYDAIWTNAQHMHTCRSYWEVLYRCPVVCLPHVWEPLFLDRAIGELGEDAPWGYQPGRKAKRVSIMEPNINIVKTCHYPVLGCELAVRRERQLLEHVMVWCGLGVKEHLTFRKLIMSLDLQKHGLISFEGRNITAWVMAKYTDIVVSHQWENALNFAYYEVLYGGYPLVHCSDLLPHGVGYRYEQFDAQSCAEQLSLACHRHDRELESYRERADCFLASISLRDDENILQHQEALFRL